MIVLWLKPILIVHFDTCRVWDSKFVKNLNKIAYFGSGKFFNLWILGFFPITLSIFSHLFNSQWRSGCVLDFHSNVLSSIPSIKIFFKTFLRVDSLSEAMDCSTHLVVRLKPLFRKISWPRGCVLDSQPNVLSSIPAIDLFFKKNCQREQSFKSFGVLLFP